MLLTKELVIKKGCNQSNFWESLNGNMNKIDSISNEIYILYDFTISLSLNDYYIFSKKMLSRRSVPSAVKSCYEFCAFLVCIKSIKVPTFIACNSASIIDRIFASCQERFMQKGIIDRRLSDHQLISAEKRVLRLKEAWTNLLKVQSCKVKKH